MAHLTLLSSHSFVYKLFENSNKNRNVRSIRSFLLTLTSRRFVSFPIDVGRMDKWKSSIRAPPFASQPHPLVPLPSWIGCDCSRAALTARRAIPLRLVVTCWESSAAWGTRRPRSRPSSRPLSVSSVWISQPMMLVWETLYPISYQTVSQTRAALAILSWTLLPFLTFPPPWRGKCWSQLIALSLTNLRVAKLGQPRNPSNGRCDIDFEAQSPHIVTCGKLFVFLRTILHKLDHHPHIWNHAKHHPQTAHRRENGHRRRWRYKNVSKLHAPIVVQ